MSLATVSVHQSVFPRRIRQELLDSLRRRELPQKFHYDSVKQTLAWLALHKSLSPASTDAGCQAAYERAFEAACAAVPGAKAHVIGLGCGGGDKDARLIELLSRGGRKIHYHAVDVSLAMVLTARDAALKLLSPEDCSLLVCDLPAVADWEQLLPRMNDSWPRVITFLGMMPTLAPSEVLPQLAALVRSEDQLLLSANLAPGSDYTQGVARLLPQYDNPLTRDWLMMFLLDVGFQSGDGQVVFGIEENPPGSGLRRVQATFHLERPRRLQLGPETLDFTPGDRIRLFFSYRHTPGQIHRLLGAYGLEIRNELTAASGEEAVFLARRAARRSG